MNWAKALPSPPLKPQDQHMGPLTLDVPISPHVHCPLGPEEWVPVPLLPCALPSPCGAVSEATVSPLGPEVVSLCYGINEEILHLNMLANKPGRNGAVKPIRNSLSCSKSYRLIRLPCDRGPQRPMGHVPSRRPQSPMGHVPSFAYVPGPVRLPFLPSPDRCMPQAA